MTTVTRNTSFDPARFIALCAGALALACLVFIAYMLWSSNRRDKAVSGQQYSECIERAFRYDTDISVCGERYRAGAR